MNGGAAVKLATCGAVESMKAMSGHWEGGVGPLSSIDWLCQPPRPPKKMLTRPS